jgi:molybdenum cofactor guanylyltransferase
MAERSPFAAAILTGGRAERMGGLRKGEIEIGGVRIIDRQLAALREVTDTIFEVVAADSTGPPSADGLRVVQDHFPRSGALGGIYTAIVESPSLRTLVVGCDMPFLSSALLRHMADVDADLVIPRSERGHEPLCAIYSKNCAPPLRRRLESGELKASVLPEGVKIAEIGPEVLAGYDPDGLLFVNVNTPHDCERARTLLERRSKTLRDRIMDELAP